MKINRSINGAKLLLLLSIAVGVALPESSLTRSTSGNTLIAQTTLQLDGHENVGADRCEQCHQTEINWWFSDRHFTTAEPFFSRQTEYVKIARLYGMTTSQMVQTESHCVACHGTVVSGVFSSGVSCESCHGSASDYLAPHSEAKRAMGTEPSSNQMPLGLGMIEVRNIDRRAEVCASCHLIKDPRLISAGHPVGTRFDFAAANTSIKHWEYPVVAASELRAAFQRITTLRGFQQVRVQAIGPVQRAGRPIRQLQQNFENTAVPSGTGQQGSNQPSSIQRSRRPEPLTLRDSDRVRQPDASSNVLELPPLPEITDETSIEDILLIVKQRLELLFQKLYSDQPNQEEN